MTQNLEMCVFAITQWVYFTYNYPEPKPMFKQIFGERMGAHIYAKWIAYGCDFNRLYTELDRENQTILAKWIIDNYHGMDSRRPK